MFDPERVRVPDPVLVKPPAPEITPVLIAVAYAPSTVNKNPPLTILPVNVRPPDPEEIMVASAVNVIGIDSEAALALEFNKAPEDETPVPAKLTPCQVDKVRAFISKAPPDSTFIVLVEEPVHVLVGL